MLQKYIFYITSTNNWNSAMLKLIKNEKLSQNIAVEILSLTAGQPDDEGQVCPEVRYRVTNNSPFPCESLDIDALIINEFGQIVHHYRERYDSGPINSGDSEDLEFGSYNFFPAIFGGNIERIRLLVRVTANNEISEVFDPMEIPHEPFKISPIASTKFLDVAQVYVDGSIWVEEDPASFKGRRLQMRFVVQNNSGLNLQNFQYESMVVDKPGKALQGDDGYNDISAGAIGTIETYIEFKDPKKLNSAKLALKLSTQIPFAEGFADHDGLIIDQKD